MWLVPDLPSPEAAPEALRALVAALGDANAQLREAAGARDAQLAARDAEAEAARAQIAVLTERLAEVERGLGKDSSASSRPPSSDSPYTKKPRDRSLRGRSGRAPGPHPPARARPHTPAGGPQWRGGGGPTGG